MKNQKPLVNTIIIDICTVKIHPKIVLKKYPQISYICTHPMFGPYSYKKIGEKLDGLRIVITDSNLDTNRFNLILSIFKKLNLNIIQISSEEHDLKLAKTLFVTHLVGQTINSISIDKKSFHDVYNYNPYCKKVLQDFKISINNILLNN